MFPVNNMKKLKIKDLVKKLQKLDQNKFIAFGDVSGNLDFDFYCIDDEVLKETEHYYMILEKTKLSKK